MPLSARVGFFNQPAAAPAPSFSFPDYPTVPSETEYTNYLSNVSATAATTIATNQTPNVAIAGYTVVADATGNLHIPLRQTNKGSNFVKIDPATNTVSNTLSSGFGHDQFQGGTLGNNSLIYFAPRGNNSVGEFNPTTNTLTILPITGGPSGTVKYYGALTLPDGDILCLPQTNHKLLRFTPGNNAAVQVGQASGVSNNGYGGFKLAPNGNVYVFPNGNNNCCKYDPVANTWTSIGSGFSKYRGGAVMNNGNILVAPDNVTNFLHIDTATDTVTTKTFAGISIDTGQSTPYCYGATEAPNGNVIMLGYKAQEHYEIDGTAGTGSEHSSSISARPTFLAGAYGKNDKVYGVTAAYGSSPNGRMDILTTNANTSVVTSTNQLSFGTSPVGGGSL